MLNISQKTINKKVSCSGVALHSGAIVNITLFPAPCNSGIIFKRIDLENSEIKANYKNVTETKLGTVISNESGAKVSTIEHLMAALWGCGIDNLIIEINGPEVPIMDGSSEPFVFLIECAGIEVQSEPRLIIEILKKVRVEDGDKFIEINPARELALDLEIEFANHKIQKQKFNYHSVNASFKIDICRARTFTFKHEIDHLQKLGLIKGGSLDNAIVVDDEGVVNQGGLRYNDEFVRHKTLDFIGDMYLAGHYILGHFSGFKTGHGVNNKFLHELFSDSTNYRLV